LKVYFSAHDVTNNLNWTDTKEILCSNDSNNGGGAGSSSTPDGSLPEAE